MEDNKGNMKNKNFDTWLAIGLNILHYRKEQGLTQIQLAEKCGIMTGGPAMP